ncbi:MAG: hypothetical protein HOI95_21590, partial [Chromatiales bacterium]|nr:hypothetical protein [Chromatiales bacterium]
ESLKAIHPSLVADDGATVTPESPDGRAAYRARWGEILQLEAVERRYIVATNEAVNGGDYKLAERLLEAGIEHLRQTEDLTRLNREVVTELRRIRDQRRAVELVAELEPQWEGFGSLTEFDAVRPQLLELAQVGADSALLQSIRRRVHGMFAVAQDRAIGSSDGLGAHQLLLEYAGLLDFPFLREQKTQLASASLPTGEANLELVNSRLAAVEGALSSPQFSHEWDRRLETSLKELEVLLPHGDPGLKALAGKTTQVLAVRARELGGRHQYKVAFKVLAQARAINPVWPEFNTVQAELDNARTAYDREQARLARLARLAELKQTVIDNASNDEPDAAKRALAELRAELPQDDAFVAEEAPKVIATSYLRLAAALAQRDDFETAIRLINNGIELAPALDGLDAARSQYLQQIEDRATAAQRLAPLPADATLLVDGLRAVSEQRASIGVAPPASRVSRSPSYRASSDVAYPSAGSHSAMLEGDLLPKGATIVRDLGTPALDGAVAARVAESMLRGLPTIPERIFELASPLATYKALYPTQSATLQARLAEATSRSVEVAADDASGDVERLTPIIADFRSVFPDQADAFVDRLSAKVGKTIVAHTREQSGAVGQAAQRLTGFASVFPDAHEAVARQVRGLVAQGLERLARSAGTAIETLEEPLGAVRTHFPDASGDIESSVASIVVRNIEELASTTGRDVDSLTSPALAFRKLLPSRSDAMAAAVVPAKLRALATAVRSTPPSFEWLGASTERLNVVFPGSRTEAADRLVPVALEALLAAARDLPIAQVTGLAEELHQAFP